MRFGLVITLCFAGYVLIFGPVAMLPPASTEEKMDVKQSSSDIARRLLQKREIDHKYAVQFETELLLFLVLMGGLFAFGAASLNPKYGQIFKRFE